MTTKNVIYPGVLTGSWCHRGSLEGRAGWWKNTHQPFSWVVVLNLQKEACTNGHGKTTSMIPLIIFVFGEFSSPVIAPTWRRSFLHIEFLWAILLWRCIPCLNLTSQLNMYMKNAMHTCSPMVWNHHIAYDICFSYIFKYTVYVIKYICPRCSMWGISPWMWLIILEK